MLRQLLRVPETRKAWIAAVIAVLTAVITAYGPDSDAGKLCAIVIAGLTGLGAVYAIPNKTTGTVTDTISDATGGLL